MQRCEASCVRISQVIPSLEQKRRRGEAYQKLASACFLQHPRMGREHEAMDLPLVLSIMSGDDREVVELGELSNALEDGRLLPAGKHLADETFVVRLFGKD